MWKKFKENRYKGHLTTEGSSSIQDALVYTSNISALQFTS